MPCVQAGRDFPRNYAELRAWFPDDDACLDYLQWLRWPDGFACPGCGETARCWRTGDGRLWCEGCRRRVSTTSGTIFHRTRTPLTVWFAVAWYMTCKAPRTGGTGGARHLPVAGHQPIPESEAAKASRWEPGTGTIPRRNGADPPMACWRRGRRTALRWIAQ